MAEVSRIDSLWGMLHNGDNDAVLSSALEHIEQSRCIEAIYFTGLALARLKRPKAIPWLTAALTLVNAPAEWYVNAAVAARGLGQPKIAGDFAQNGLMKFPGHAQLLYLKGASLCALLDWEGAQETLRQAIAAREDFFDAAMSRGYTLHMLGRYDEALIVYAPYLQTAPEWAHENLVDAVVCLLLEMGRPQDALALLDKYYPKNTMPHTLLTRSFLELGLGLWPQAWQTYKHRTSGDGTTTTHGVPPNLRPQTLSDIRCHSVMLLHEQGMGDSIQFLRYAPMVYPLVSRLVIGVPGPLVRLVQHMKPDCEVIRIDGGNLPETGCRWVIPVMDLPALFEQGMVGIPRCRWFHIPHVERGDHHRPRVGLCWSGDNRSHDHRLSRIDKQRSVPFKLMGQLLKMSDRIDFISLQMPDHRVDDGRLQQPIEEGFDLLDTAKIVDGLDLIISVDTAVAHLAASMNKPTWLLSRFGGCWRWFWDGRDTSIWYPSLRIFHQQAHDSWPDVLLRVESELETSQCRH